MRGNQCAEDPLTYGYAKFLAELNQNLGHVEQERYLALRPTFAPIYWLMSSAPDWRASLLQRRDMGSQPVWPLNAQQDTSINVVLQRERSIIKALVLAEATPEFIAAQLEYDPAVIMNFEKLCWDIRGRAQARAWIHNFVFPEGIQAAIDPSDFERLLFQRAYTHGLEGVLKFLHLSGHVIDPKTYARELSQRNGADLIHKTTTTIQSLTPTQRNGHEVLATAVTADKAEREMELKKATAEKEDPAAHGSDAPAKLMESMAVVAKGFAVADPTVSYGEGAEERLDDSKFHAALTQALQEVQLTPG
jgi:hypothetical protein